MNDSGNELLTALLFIGMNVLCGAAGHAVARRKRPGSISGAVLGLWLGPLGLAIMWAIEPRRGTPRVTARWYDRADVVLSLVAFAVAGLAFGYAVAGPGG